MACETTASSRWNHRELVLREGRQRISVVLAARDGATTVGAILLVDTVALVDELVVIDSGSTDATGAIGQYANPQLSARDRTCVAASS